MIVSEFAKRCAGVISTTRKIGQFKISTDGDALNPWISPEFNLEVAIEYAAAMDQTIDRMPSVLGVITRFERPPIIGPDVEASLKQTAKRRGMVAVSSVIPDLDHTDISIAVPQWHRIYDAIDVYLRSSRMSKSRGLGCASGSNQPERSAILKLLRRRGFRRVVNLDFCEHWRAGVFQWTTTLAVAAPSNSALVASRR